MSSPPLLVSCAADGVATLTLNRPDVRNALDRPTVDAMRDALERCRDDATRVVVVRGVGRSFCAGADLAWMQRMAGVSEQENFEDARGLAALLDALDRFPKPTLAAVHGPTYGGGVGLVACCDIAIASRTAVFSLSEVKLGLIPGIISPFVVAAIGGRAARRYFQSGERFGAPEALRMGLVHELAADPDLDRAVETCVAALLEGGPRAQAEAKQLIATVRNAPADAALLDETARRIARVRASEEAREGLAAFFAKRRPRWTQR